MKRISLLPSVFVMSTTAVFADAEKDDNDNTYTTRTAVMAITEKNVHGTRGGKNPAHIRSKGPFLTADFLYWKAGIDGLEIATENFQNSTFSSFNMDEMSFTAEWRPGVRAGLGWLFGDLDQWDIYADWTFFYDKADVSNHSKNFLTHNFIPKWSSILGPIANDVSGNWNLHFNMIDLEVGRNYFISRKIALRPHVGLRGGWIDLNYHAKYNGIWLFQSLPSGIGAFGNGTTSFDAESTFKGLGVRSGADFLWHFSDHWGLSSQISAALLYGRFHIDETFHGFQPVGIGANNNGILTPIKVTYDKGFNRVRANIDAFLGLFFETGISNDKYHFTMQAGYELSEWFEQNELVVLNSSTDGRVLQVPPSIPATVIVAANNDTLPIPQKGNLGLQGLTIKLQFNF